MVCLTVCLSYCMIVCLFYANSAAKILLFLHICKQNPKNLQNLPISAFFCFIVLYCALFCFFPLCALFAHHCANLLSPLSGAGGGLLSFFISVAYLRQFSPALFLFSFFPRLVPFSIFLLLQANSICRSSLSLVSGSDPDKTPPNSPFRPENLIILTFPSPKICTYQKKCVPLHRISGSPLIH